MKFKGLKKAPTSPDASKKFIAYAKSSLTNGSVTVEGNLYKGIEIVRTGVFRGKLFDRSYWQKMVDNFYAMKESGVFSDVPVRADHPDFFGMKPIIDNVKGYVKDIYLKENGTITVKVPVLDENGKETRMEKVIPDVRVVADFEITEPEAEEKMKRGTYRNRSIEFGMFQDNDGNEYAPVLWGVAFVDIPQVDKLKSMFTKFDKRSTDIAVFDVDEEVATEEVKADDQPQVEAPSLNDDEPKTEVKSEVVDDGPAVDEDTPVEGESGDEPKEEKTGDEPKEQPKEEETVEEPKSEPSVDEPKEDVTTEPKDEEFVKMSKRDVDELTKLREERRAIELSKKIDVINAFVTQGRSIPAMAELESQLVKAFYAKPGEEGYLSPDQMFELFKSIKLSTPEIWAKKDSVVQLDDRQEVESELSKQNGTTGKLTKETQEEVVAMLKKNGLSVKE